ncbi:hypothetical protein KU43_03050 [Mesotoga sp. SC_NapDC2]|nr:hypothetical protein KU43_03050 [Mesotoga sp. SC_NapDC2]
MNLSPRKKKTEETPNEQVEKVPIEKAANKRTTKRKAESKKTESKKTESKKNETKRDVENQKANITPSNESGKEKEEVMTISKKNYEEPNADGPVAQETFREGVMDDAKEIPKKDKDKDKDNIREVEIDISQLQAMPIREVYKLARKYDVQGYTQMAKKDLIFAVLKEGLLTLLPLTKTCPWLTSCLACLLLDANPILKTMLSSLDSRILTRALPVSSLFLRAASKYLLNCLSRTP